MPRGKRKTTTSTAEPKHRGRPRKTAPAPEAKPVPEAPRAKPAAPAKAEKEPKTITNTATITKDCRTVERVITDTVGLTVRLADGVAPPKQDAVVNVAVGSEKFQLVAKFIQPRKSGGHTIWLFLRTRDDEGKKMQQGKRWRECRLRTCSVSL